MRSQLIVDLVRRNIDPATHDNVLAAADVSIEFRLFPFARDFENIARAKVTIVRKDLGVCFGRLVVTVEYRRTPDLELSLLAGFADLLARFQGDEARLHVVTGPIGPLEAFDAKPREELRALSIVR